jgi:endonuclease YncB( thermonuclease family)
MGCLISQTLNKQTQTHEQSILNITKNDFVHKTFSNTTTLTLQNYYTLARVVDIYDADTIICIIYIFNDFYKFNIRLGGIDTCEMKSHNEVLKQHAYVARNRLFALITGITINNTFTRIQLREILNTNNYVIKILCDKFDKYGRLLGYIYNMNTHNNDVINSYNQILVKEKLAYEYSGKTKLTDKEQIKLLGLT